MLRYALAFFLAASPAALLAAQPGSESESKWGLAEAPGTCMLHAASGEGTVVSIWGFAGQAKLGFLIQNPQWESLREGQSYQIELGFAGARAWPIRATARRDLDSDGPGYFFTVEPGDSSDGSSLLGALADAEAMKISRDGAHVDSVKLAGSRDALGGLARCMSALWAAPREEILEKEDAEVPVDPTA